MLHEPSEIVTLTRDQVRAVDRIAIEELGMPGLLLMENAAMAIEEVVLSEIAGTGGPVVVVVCGAGNNGGDGLAVARKLWIRGVGVRVVLAMAPGAFGGDAGVNLAIAERVGVPIEMWEQCAPLDAGIVVDALFGTGLSRGIAGDAADAVAWINASSARVIAVDVPSGLDCDSGAPMGGACVRADVTVTLAARKAGFDQPGAAAWTGRVEVGDIGVPAWLLRRCAAMD